ncbi:MAG: hypothetical protein Roseis2KO_56200 [Roseivirga sp.]
MKIPGYFKLNTNESISLLSYYDIYPCFKAIVLPVRKTSALPWVYNKDRISNLGAFDCAEILIFTPINSEGQ